MKIFNALLNAQVYEEEVGVLSGFDVLETAEPFSGTIPLDFPPPGMEAGAGYSPARAGGATEMSLLQRMQGESLRRRKEAQEGRPVMTTFSGQPGRPEEFKLGQPPVTGQIGMGMALP